MSRKQQHTAAQEILIAALHLDRSGKVEFTEWDLTVQAWQANNARFGCRGYEEQYPDHKRVMMEIMGKKKDNPVIRGWIEKVRQNTYVVTSLGRAEGTSLANIRGDVQESVRSSSDLYDVLSRYTQHAVFLNYKRNSVKPRTWLDVSAFIGLRQNNGQAMRKAMDGLRQAIDKGRSYFRESENDILVRGVSSGGVGIRSSDIDLLEEIKAIIASEFKLQIDAILKIEGS